jgi:heme-degrading monooxygenase HmoA
MPVLMTLRVPGDAQELERRATENPGRMQAIADDAKTRGAISHRFYANDAGEIMVVDEWESPEAFQAFFAAHPEIQDLMAEIGVTTEPTVTFWRELDTHDSF